jgi:hypothetical protein
MKILKTILFALFIALSLPLIHSCGKYPDGPNFTLLTRKSRLEGTWVASEIIHPDGTTTSDPGAGASMECTKDGDVTLYSGIYTVSGTWTFTKDKKNIRITYAGLSSVEYEIRRLKNKEMWLKETDGSLTKFDKTKD